jgi:transcriptional regulator with XRE-family HTH domain
MDLGSTIRKLRKEKGMKLKDVARKAGLSNNGLCSIEKNYCFPTQKNFYAICDAIGVPHYIVLAECVTIDDVPPEKREAFNLLWPPIMKYLKGDK